jgi:hypothetical protein
MLELSWLSELVFFFFSGILLCNDEVYGDPKRCKTIVQLAFDTNSNHLADNATNWVNIPTLDEADSTTFVPVVNSASTIAAFG